METAEQQLENAISLDVLYLVIVVLTALVLVAISKRFQVQGEIFVLIISGFISFIPSLPRFHIDGEIFLLIILPPLLFSSARNIGAYKFTSLKRPILSLAILLVIVTGLAVGFVAYETVPFITIGSALIIGSLVAPTDAVSALAIGRKLKLNDRLLTILTGESLINDACALTLYSVGLSLVMRTSTFIDNIPLLFIYQLGIGLVVGLAFGFLTHYIRKILKDSSLITVFTAVVPFATYITAVELQASGVIAVVICGFIVERSTFESNYTTRIQETNFWQALDTMFEVFVFAYMGLQVRFIFDDLASNDIAWWQALLLTVPILLTTIFLRPLWVFGTSFIGKIADRLSRDRLRKISKKLYSQFTNQTARERMRSKIIKKHDVLNSYKISDTNWKENTIISWAGMRGVVSLAIAGSVPNAVNGSGSTLITSFILEVGLIVALFTLIFQASTLPIIIKRLNIGEGKDQKTWVINQNHKIRQLLDDSAERVFDDLESEGDADEDEVARIRKAWSTLRRPYEARDDEVFSEFIGLFKTIAETQRQDIIDAVNSGAIDPDLAKDVLHKLDSREAFFE